MYMEDDYQALSSTDVKSILNDIYLPYVCIKNFLKLTHDLTQ